MANGVGVCTINFLDNAVITKSSENLTYPMINALNLQRRQKVWRTAGYWKIESGSNTIVFQETTGTDLTATIAPGEYTTAGLAAAIVSALEAVGAAEYEATQLSNGFWRLRNDNSSGTTLVFRFSISTAMANILGFDTVDITATLGGGFRTATADQFRIHTSEWIQADMGIPTNPKAFCFVGDRNKPLKISKGATLKLQANPTSDWSSPAIDLTITHNDNAIATWNFEGLADVTAGYRYWRFLIIDKDNPRGYIEIGNLFLGDMLSFDRGCVVFPLQQRGVDQSVTVVSEGGQVYGLKKPKTTGINVEWRALKVSEEEELFWHWERVGITDNWFFILDEAGAFSSDSKDRVKLVRFAQEHQETLFRPKNFQATWSLLEAL